MTSPLGPGATIGILGGGQLGRMLSVAAARLGLRSHILDPSAAPPAADVAHALTTARYDDPIALAAFAASVDVITYEFENIPTAALDLLEATRPIRPGRRALAISQDRLAEKSFLQGIGLPVAPYAAVTTASDLAAALARIGTPAILKTTRLGYDGKGQVRLAHASEAAAAFAALGGRDLIAEGFVRFAAEFSIIVARGLDGSEQHYPAIVNRHVGGILSESRVPAEGISPSHVAAATALVVQIADALSYVGVLTCEFFACESGPVFNEMAPRVHNSGHWTIEGAATSQFEQHVRAICGLPLGDVGLLAPRVMMRNLLGDDVHGWAGLLAEPGARLHLYGKSAAEPGRKMGHVTYLQG